MTSLLWVEGYLIRVLEREPRKAAESYAAYILSFSSYSSVSSSFMCLVWKWLLYFFSRATKESAYLQNTVFRWDLKILLNELLSRKAIIVKVLLTDQSTICNYFCWNSTHSGYIFRMLDEQQFEVISDWVQLAVQLQSLETSLHGNERLKDQSKESG